MFVNQVSIKDLFTTNASSCANHRQDPGDTTIENGSQSNSQFTYSQVDFTDSQDASQSYSQSQTSDSPGRKFYQRYISKGPVFSRDVPSRSTVPIQPQSYQQQMATNKAKARDRDERDILNTMLNTLKCTSSEVKEVVSSVKQHIANGQEDIKHGLQKHLENLEARLAQYNNELTKALELRGEVKEQVNVLQTKLTERESYIDSLKDEIMSLKSSNDQEILTSMEKLFKDDRDNLQEHIKYLYKQHECTLKKQGSHQQDLHEEFMQLSKQQNKQIATRFKSALTEIGQNLKSELSNQWKEMQNDQGQLSQQLLTDLQQMQAEHVRQMADMFSRQVKLLDGDNEGRLKRFLQEQHKHLHSLQQNYMQQLQDFIKQHLSSFGKDQKVHMDAMIDSVWCKANTTMTATRSQSESHDELEKIKQRHIKEVESLKKQRDAIQRERKDNNSNIHEWLKTPHPGVSHDRKLGNTALNSYDNTATSEVSNSSRSMNTALRLNLCAVENGDILHEETIQDFPPLASPLLWNYPPWNTDGAISAQCGTKRGFGLKEGKVDIKFSNRSPNNMGFVSPLTSIARSLNSKGLFQRPNPSPVATVFPQIQSQQNDSTSKCPKKKSRKRPRRNPKYGNKRGKKQVAVENHDGDTQEGDNPDMEPETLSSPMAFDTGRDVGSSFITERNDNHPLAHFTTYNKPVHDEGFGKHDANTQEIYVGRPKRGVFEFSDNEHAGTVFSNQAPSTSRGYQPMKTYSKTATVAPQRSLTLNSIKPLISTKDESETEESDGLLSQESSPSLSVKEVFIKHIYKKDRGTPVSSQGLSETNIYMQSRHQSHRRCNNASRAYSSTHVIAPTAEVRPASYELRSPIKVVKEKEEVIQPRITRRRAQKRKRQI